MPEEKVVSERRANPVWQLMEGLLSEGPKFVIFYRGKTYQGLNDPDLPVMAGVQFLFDQLRELKKLAKEQAAGATPAKE